MDAIEVSIWQEDRFRFTSFTAPVLLIWLFIFIIKVS
jgi:hypothetical protein